MRFALTTALTLIAAVAFAAVPASAQPACGDLITQDTTLEADLSCPDTDVAIVIGASGVTLDLDGHHVSGRSNGVLNEGHHQVTVRNGHVSSDGVPVYLDGVTSNTVRDVVAGGTNYGIWLSRSDRNRIVSNQLTGLVALADGSDGNTVARNSWRTGEDGLFIGGSSGNRIVDNSMAGVDGTPIFLNGAHHNRIARNSVRSLYNGITLLGSNGNELVDNVIANAGTFPAAGPELRDSSHNVLRRNYIIGTFFGTWVVSGQGNVLADNVLAAGSPYDFSPTELDGIRVEPAATGTRLLRNVALRFDDDGFDVEYPGALLRRNVANDNGDLGIEAVPGVTDGGGNRASGNGDPLQCINVFCR